MNDTERAYDEYTARFGAIQKNAGLRLYLEWFGATPIDQIIAVLERLRIRDSAKRPMLAELQELHREMFRKAFDGSDFALDMARKIDRKLIDDCNCALNGNELRKLAQRIDRMLVRRTTYKQGLLEWIQRTDGSTIRSWCDRGVIPGHI